MALNNPLVVLPEHLPTPRLWLRVPHPLCLYGGGAAAARLLRAAQALVALRAKGAQSKSEMPPCSRTLIMVPVRGKAPSNVPRLAYSSGPHVRAT
jgi:hypothetical protein